MATIVEGARPVLDGARSLLDGVGLREFRAYLRVRDWSGGQAGHGTMTETRTELTVANGGKPKVVALSPRQVVASGGQLGDTMFEIGPLTPAYPGGGVTPEDVNPPKVKGREMHYILVGPGLPAEGAVCKLVSANHSSPFRVMLRVQQTGER